MLSVARMLMADKSMGRAVIRVVLGHRGTLVRGALAAVLARENRSGRGGRAGPLGRRPASGGRAASRTWSCSIRSCPARIRIEDLCRKLTGRGVLVLIDHEAIAATSLALVKQAPRIGSDRDRLRPRTISSQAVRDVAKGLPVVDVRLAVAALKAGDNPLTDRECEVLRQVTTGATAQEIARTLSLSAGTVRNYLSRISPRPVRAAGSRRSGRLRTRAGSDQPSEVPVSSGRAVRGTGGDVRIRVWWVPSAALLPSRTRMRRARSAELIRCAITISVPPRGRRPPRRVVRLRDRGNRSLRRGRRAARVTGRRGASAISCRSPADSSPGLTCAPQPPSRSTSRAGADRLDGLRRPRSSLRRATSR